MLLIAFGTEAMVNLALLSPVVTVPVLAGLLFLAPLQRLAPQMGKEDAAAFVAAISAVSASATAASAAALSACSALASAFSARAIAPSVVALAVVAKAAVVQP